MLTASQHGTERKETDGLRAFTRNPSMTDHPVSFPSLSPPPFFIYFKYLYRWVPVLFAFATACFYFLFLSFFPLCFPSIYDRLVTNDYDCVGAG